MRPVRAQEGFTLIELLVVILIIGILAAIAIPSFLGQRSKAQDAEAKTQVRVAQTAMETYFTEGQTYEGADFDALVKIEPTLEPVRKRFDFDADYTGYRVSVGSLRKDDYGSPAADFTISRWGKVLDRTCYSSDNAAAGGCPASGKW